jgi:hypothetical protein
MIFITSLLEMKGGFFWEMPIRTTQINLSQASMYFAIKKDEGK